MPYLNAYAPFRAHTQGSRCTCNVTSLNAKCSSGVFFLVAFTDGIPALGCDTNATHTDSLSSDEDTFGPCTDLLVQDRGTPIFGAFDFGCH